MTEKERKIKEIQDKVGALHLRLTDDEANYHDIIGHMAYYRKDNAHYSEDLLNALRDGLDNYERYMNLQNALSPRCIKIVKRPEGEKYTAADTEGAYQVVFHFDDDSETIVHFSRKSEQLLYMLMVMSSFKNGYISEFLHKPKESEFYNLNGPGDEDVDDLDDEELDEMVREIEGTCDGDDEADLDDSDIDLDDEELEDIIGHKLHTYDQYLEQYNHNVEVIEKLAKMIYPRSNVKGLWRDLDYDVSFSDILQKMRASLNKCLQSAHREDEKQWFFPHDLTCDSQRVYQLQMAPANIILPKEMIDLISQLPDAKDYIDLSKGGDIVNDNGFIDGLIALAMEDGDTRSMNMLGDTYLNGWNRVADKDKAFHWFKKSAEAGDSHGLYMMGVFYATGDCVEQDYKKAIQYFKKAAADEHDEALYWLGKCSMHGFGCKKDWEKALSYFTEATELGNAEAANEAGYLLTNGGFGLEKDEEEAFEYYLEAAKLDHPEAMRYVIRAYREGIVEDENDDLDYWINRSEKLNLPENYAQIGMMMYEDENYEEAFRCLFNAFQGGMFSVCPFLSSMQIKGEGVEVDTHLAMCYLRDGAKGGDEPSMNKLIQLFPDEWAQLEPEIKASVNYRELLIELVGALTPEGNQEYFLKLIDAYREKFIDNTYIQEINRQLSIHRPSTDDGSRGDGRRHIIVRKSDSNKVGYEIVVILANGTEVVVNSINTNSLMIYLLAIICSYKSGYTRDMAKSSDCLPLIVGLYKQVVPNAKDSEARYFIENFLDPDSKNNYYKLYSYRATQAITKAVGINDDPTLYLFDNEALKNRKVVRRMLIDAKDIELPAELMELARVMPDAMNVLNLSDKQEVMK